MNPVRMMLLDPRMVVGHPPVTIVPLMMRVVVADARRISRRRRIWPVAVGRTGRRRIGSMGVGRTSRRWVRAIGVGRVSGAGLRPQPSGLMGLDPRAIVVHPPIAIMPLMMLVIGTIALGIGSGSFVMMMVVVAAGLPHLVSLCRYIGMVLQELVKARMRV